MNVASKIFFCQLFWRKSTSPILWSSNCTRHKGSIGTIPYHEMRTVGIPPVSVDFFEDPKANSVAELDSVGWSLRHDFWDLETNVRGYLISDLILSVCGLLVFIVAAKF